MLKCILRTMPVDLDAAVVTNTRLSSDYNVIAFAAPAIGSLANLIDPELVLIGGGFGEAAGEFLLGPAQAAARREALAPLDETLRVLPAGLGSEAGLSGAALVGFEALDGAW